MSASMRVRLGINNGS
ncbi:hypothetical protein MTR67_022297 [Solanum verrucosum]|uniref:Uncharacterized protein n=1 Tax=Solanum verrucosum TaxID=315347 RepID=A0AAF0TQF4_SOLVR|nr:hypothetical protein MTR67_022297 [Solanum verrucosum]